MTRTQEKSQRNVLLTDRLTKNRTLMISLAYSGILILASIDWYYSNIHLGALCVLPVLVIAYVGNRTAALVTAIPCAAIFSTLDHDYFETHHVMPFIIPADAIILAASLIAIVLVVERFREASLRNTLLETDLERARLFAERDPLTSLPNRTAYTNRLEHALKISHITGSKFGVLFADLDGFKKVNDEQGHDAGDRILFLAAERLKYTMRSKDSVSRIGGDEFAAIIEDISGRNEAIAIAAKLEEAFLEPFNDNGARYRVGITVGVSMYGEDGSDGQTLLRVADRAMYERKRTKKSASIGANDPLPDSPEP